MHRNTKKNRDRFFSVPIFLCIFLFFQLNSEIVVIGAPKCGSHLVNKVFKILLNKNSRFSYTFDNVGDSKFFYWTHLKYTPENQKLIDQFNKKFLIIRDPRDQIISFIHWAKKEVKERPEKYNVAYENTYGFREVTPNYKKYLDKPIYYIISKLIKYGTDFYDGFGPYKGNDHETVGIDEFYSAYLDWLKDPNICLIKFENLIGSKGGGNNKLQANEIKKIAKHLNLRVTDKKIKEIQNKLFGNSHTFRKGKIGSWKKYFNSKHKNEFKKYANNLLIKLGYEKDGNW